MSNLKQQIESIAPSNGYHIYGSIEFLIGHKSEQAIRDIDIYIVGEDAEKLGQAARHGSEEQLAQMILNFYMEEDLDEEEPMALVKSTQLTVDALG